MMRALDTVAIARELGLTWSGPALVVAGVCIDSRRVAAGDLFVALPGERVDGHDYVEAARAQGAVAAIVERPVETSLPTLQVESAMAALSTLGAANCAASSAQVLAVTGSCGKTSVKNICHAIFSRAGATVATAGNYNNELGVPLTLARLDDETRFAVVEMGATGRGDIAHLCTLAQPQVSTVLNAMEAHLDGFGSVADVADIKAEIFDGLNASGAAVLNLDSPFSELWRERIAATGARCVAWSLEREANVRALDLREKGFEGTEFSLVIDGQSQAVSLPLPGRHSVANALAAAALATAAGLSLETIAAGLAQAEAEPGRLRRETLADGTVLIDDSYNANPGSVRAAIEVLAAADGARTLILGEMLELGRDSATLHAEMGRLAKERGIQRLFGVGTAVAAAVEAFGIGAIWYRDREALAPDLADLLKRSDTVLVKGSRGAAMEYVLADLRSAVAGTAGEGREC